MKFKGGIDLKYFERCAWFWKVEIDGDIAGVNSGFVTEPSSFRSRGLYVRPEYRGQGVAKTLLQMAITQASALACDHVWSMPRQSAIHAYESVGFSKCSDFFDKNVEFGPNCYAELKL